MFSADKVSFTQSITQVWRVGEVRFHCDGRCSQEKPTCMGGTEIGKPLKNHIVHGAKQQLSKMSLRDVLVDQHDGHQTQWLL